jgi:hypothetical protein
MSHPLLYEINTRCWLRELSERAGRRITLENVPAAELAAWQRNGFTHIWLMGVWTTGPRSRAQSLQAPDLRGAYAAVLPDWTEADVPGSPYAIAEYRVPPAVGGEAGLKEFRGQLQKHGLKLVLDFVPNHLGLDHAWVKDRPELFVQSATAVPEAIAQETRNGKRWLAHGKDPYFPGWTDTVQLDYRRPATREAMVGLLQSVAARCDGVRCDMAMLELNEIFARTWERFPAPGPAPEQEFWSAAISAVKQAHPGFLFLAEAYWNLEERLQALGFDYTYDKALYDALLGGDAGAPARHLLGKPAAYVAASAHFLENHDEDRIAARLGPGPHQASALAILGLPGLRFLHEGQLAGSRLRLPVQLARRPSEPAQPEVERLYRRLLEALPGTAVGRGRAEVLSPRPAWPGNDTAQNFVIVQWQSQAPDFHLVVANLAPHRSQCYVPLTVPDLAAHNWSMKDRLGTEAYVRHGDDLQAQGLYLDLPEHGAQLFEFQPAS